MYSFLNELQEASSSFNWVEVYKSYENTFNEAWDSCIKSEVLSILKRPENIEKWEAIVDIRNLSKLDMSDEDYIKLLGTKIYQLGFLVEDVGIHQLRVAWFKEDTFDYKYEMFIKSILRANLYSKENLNQGFAIISMSELREASKLNITELINDLKDRIKRDFKLLNYSINEVCITTKIEPRYRIIRVENAVRETIASNVQEDYARRLEEFFSFQCMDKKVKLEVERE